MYDTIVHTAQHNNYNDKSSVRFSFAQDTPYLALMGELRGVFREL